MVAIYCIAANDYIIAIYLSRIYKLKEICLFYRNNMSLPLQALQLIQPRGRQ